MSRPTAFQNFLNIYQPAQGTLTGALAFNNFANPIQFLCGAVQAASRLGAKQSAKLCVQYLAPIIKNRQYNFLPLGENLVRRSQRRVPNEVTYSEDWLRPDYIPPPAQRPPRGSGIAPPPTDRCRRRTRSSTSTAVADPQRADADRAARPENPRSAPASRPTAACRPVPTNPADGLPGMMVPPGGGR